MAFGVTSTSSSSTIHSIAVSSVWIFGAGSLTASSWLCVRMLFFSFGTHGVDHHLVVAGTFADDHALVHLLAGIDEELAAELQLVERVAGGDCRDGR